MKFFLPQSVQNFVDNAYVSEGERMRQCGKRENEEQIITRASTKHSVTECRVPGRIIGERSKSG